MDTVTRARATTTPGSALAGYTLRSITVARAPRCRTASHATGSAAAVATSPPATARPIVERAAVEMSPAGKVVDDPRTSHRARLPSGIPRARTANPARAPTAA